MTVASSYKKVFYDLRPGKQIERRMLLDTFQLLSNGGFRIADYQYTGFGSIYFVDFVLFHKYLGISNLLSLEHDPDAEKRARFNKPYDIIKLEIKSAFDAIPSLDRDLKHILWLDYDFRLEASVLADVKQAAFQLSPGSILLVTVDVEPPEVEDETESNSENVRKSSPELTMQVFQEECGPFWDPTWTAEDFAASQLSDRNRDILNMAITNSLAVRPGVSFLPLFSFVYRDGHTMYTFGGMVGGDSERDKLDGCGLSRARYLRRDIAELPYDITVPRLTRKERTYLDSLMPLQPNLRRNQLGFNINELRAYEEVYRFFPTYVEALF
jgi:hypothetical protein